MSRLHAVVPAAGNGTRFGGGVPKQYAELAGRSVVAHALDRLRRGLVPHSMHVVLAQDDRDFERLAVRPAGTRVLRCGGRTRATTVANALHELAGECVDDDWVAVHDAGRGRG